MPEQHGLADALGGQQGVDVVAGAREPDDADLHGAPPRLVGREDLVVLDQRVGQQRRTSRRAGRVLDVELDEPADVDVAHALEAERRQRALDRDALRVEDPGLGPDEDPRPHGAVRASHASNGSPARRS